MASLLCTRASKRYVFNLKQKKNFLFLKTEKKKKEMLNEDITTDLLVANYFVGKSK